MPSTASTLLKTEQQADGENPNTWGSKHNATHLQTEDAIAGQASITLSNADVTLSDTQYAENQARKAVLNLSGTLTANVSIVVPDRTKLYHVKNGTSGDRTVTVKTASGNGAIVPQGSWGLVFCDGTNVEHILGGNQTHDEGSLNAKTSDTYTVEIGSIAELDADTNGTITAPSTGYGFAVTYIYNNGARTITLSGYPTDALNGGALAGENGKIDVLVTGRSRVNGTDRIDHWIYNRA